MSKLLQFNAKKKQMNYSLDVQSLFNMSILRSITSFLHFITYIFGKFSIQKGPFLMLVCVTESERQTQTKSRSKKCPCETWSVSLLDFQKYLIVRCHTFYWFCEEKNSFQLYLVWIYPFKRSRRLSFLKYVLNGAQICDLGNMCDFTNDHEMFQNLKELTQNNKVYLFLKTDHNLKCSRNTKVMANEIATNKIVILYELL